MDNYELARADSLNPGDLFRNRHGQWIKVTGVVIEDEVMIRGISQMTRKEMFCFYAPDKLRRVVRSGEAPPSI